MSLGTTEAQSCAVYEKVPCHHLAISSMPLFFVFGFLFHSYVFKPFITTSCMQVCPFFAVKRQPSQSHCKNHKSPALGWVEEDVGQLAEGCFVACLPALTARSEEGSKLRLHRRI